MTQGQADHCRSTCCWSPARRSAGWHLDDGTVPEPLTRLGPGGRDWAHD